MWSTCPRFAMRVSSVRPIASPFHPTQRKHLPMSTSSRLCAVHRPPCLPPAGARAALRYWWPAWEPPSSRFLQRGLDVIAERGGHLGGGGDDPAEPGHRGDRQQHTGDLVLT